MRYDQTSSSYNPNKDINSWNAQVMREDMERKDKQGELNRVWQQVADKYASGNMTKEEIAEWELARRISAASEQDTTELRVLEARIDYETDQQYDAIQEKRQFFGEEAMQQEIADNREQYLTDQNEARKRAMRKYGGNF